MSAHIHMLYIINWTYLLIEKKKGIEFNDLLCLCWGFTAMGSSLVYFYHTFTRKAYSSKRLTSILHILSPETDNCPSWISGSERMTVENITWSLSPTRRGLNPHPPLITCGTHIQLSHRGRIYSVYCWNLNTFESQRTFWHVPPMKTHSACASTWRDFATLAIQNAPSEDSD